MALWVPSQLLTVQLTLSCRYQLHPPSILWGRKQGCINAPTSFGPPSPAWTPLIFGLRAAHVTTMRRPLRQEITQHATQQLLHSWPSARLAERWLVIQPHMQTVIRERKAQLNKRADFFSTPDDLFPAEICAHTTHQPSVTPIYISPHPARSGACRCIVCIQDMMRICPRREGSTRLAKQAELQPWLNHFLLHLWFLCIQKTSNLITFYPNCILC